MAASREACAAFETRFRVSLLRHHCRIFITHSRAPTQGSLGRQRRETNTNGELVNNFDRLALTRYSLHRVRARICGKPAGRRSLPHCEISGTVETACLRASRERML